jgi:hypothetical protein
MSPSILRLHGCEVDLTQATAQIGCVARRLTAKEMDILSVLAAADAHMLSASELTQAVWGDRGRGRALTSALSRLRKKIEPDPSLPRNLVGSRELRLRIVEPPESPQVSWGPDPADVGAVMAELDRQAGLLTLVGPAGSGKGALCEAVRAVYRGGTYRCEVGPGDTLAARLRVALHCEGGSLDALGRALALDGRCLLIVELSGGLSSCVALDLARLATLAGSCRVLVASRGALELRGERTLAVGPVCPGRAAALLRRAFPHAEARVLEALAARTDRLLFALRWAADRNRSTAQQVLSSLEGGAADAHFAAVWGPSLRSLSVSARALLQALSRREAPFDAYDAMALGGAEGLDWMAELVAAHVLLPAGGGPSRPRYRLPQTLTRCSRLWPRPGGDAMHWTGTFACTHGPCRGKRSAKACAEGTFAGSYLLKWSWCPWAGGLPCFKWSNCGC